MSYWGTWQTFALLKPTETTKVSLLSASPHRINKATCTTTPATYIRAIDLLAQQTEHSSQILTKLVSLLPLYVSILTLESLRSSHQNIKASLMKTFAFNAIKIQYNGFSYIQDSMKQIWFVSESYCSTSTLDLLYTALKSKPLMHIWFYITNTNVRSITWYLIYRNFYGS